MSSQHFWLNQNVLVFFLMHTSIQHLDPERSDTSDKGFLLGGSIQPSAPAGPPPPATWRAENPSFEAWVTVSSQQHEELISRIENQLLHTNSYLQEVLNDQRLIRQHSDQIFDRIFDRHTQLIDAQKDFKQSLGVLLKAVENGSLSAKAAAVNSSDVHEADHEVGAMHSLACLNGIGMNTSKVHALEGDAMSRAYVEQADKDELARSYVDDADKDEFAGILSCSVTGPGYDGDRTAVLNSARSNMHFAQDLLGAYGGTQHGIDELAKAMRRCELPTAYQHRAAFGLSSEPERIGSLADFLHSDLFEQVVAVGILSNAIFIAYSTDYAVKHPQDPSTTAIAVVEIVFQAFFVIELFLKLLVHRLYLYMGSDLIWNILDSILVLAALYDITMTHIFDDLGNANADRSGAKNGFSFTFIRVLRLVRLTKVVRIFRVMRFFSELNVLLRVMLSSLRPLFWCTFMLLVFFYMFAVIFVSGTAAYLADEDADENTKSKLRESFGSVAKSILSLSQASTGGKDWADVADPLDAIGHAYYVLFLIFIAFVLIALLNILTGIFVDRAFKAVANDKDGMALEHLHQDRQVVADLCRLHCAITGKDIDAGATISADAWRQFTGSPVMRARLAVLDLEIWDSSQFFNMLTSINGKKEVDLPDFVVGCMQLRGLAKRVSTQAIHADLKMMRKTLRRLGDRVAGLGKVVSKTSREAMGTNGAFARAVDDQKIRSDRRLETSMPI